MLFKLEAMCFGVAKPYYSILNECCPNYLALFKKAPEGAFLNNAKLQIIGVSRYSWELLPNVHLKKFGLTKS